MLVHRGANATITARHYVGGKTVLCGPKIAHSGSRSAVFLATRRMFYMNEKITRLCYFLKLMLTIIFSKLTTFQNRTNKYSTEAQCWYCIINNETKE